MDEFVNFAEEEERAQGGERAGDLETDVRGLVAAKKDAGSVQEDDDDNLSASDADNGIDAENGEDDADAAIVDEDEAARKRREFEERFDAVMKRPTKRRRNNNDVDLEAMQDEMIAALKNRMKQAAYDDVECINEKKPATHKLKLLPKVKDTLIKANLYDSILDNNMLEAVRIWLEPLPDASLPSYEIQRTLLTELIKMPIKTIHLRESGLGKVILFYQQSAKVDSGLKRIAEKLIGDWTRPIMGRSDNYRAKKVASSAFDHERFNTRTKLATDRVTKPVKKSLYQEAADRRKRTAAPEARTSVYTKAPKVDPSKLQSQVAAMSQKSETFKKIAQKLTVLSSKKSAKKSGPSIEGRGLNTM